MLVGPVNRVEEKDGKYIVEIETIDPSFGGVTRRTVKIIVENAETVEINGKKYIRTDDPWAVPLGARGSAIVPRIENERIYNVVPVAILSRTGTDKVEIRRFLGYYVVFDTDGKPKEVRYAGEFIKIIPREIADKEPGLPVQLTRPLSALDKDYYVLLARYTPLEFLEPLDRAGRRDIVSLAVAEMIRRDPLAVKMLPEKIVKKYLLQEEDAVVKTALMETSPAVIKSLIQELEALGYRPGDLDRLYEHLEEEKKKREEERKKKEEEKEEEERRRREKEEEKRIREEERRMMDAIKEVMGIALPPVIATAALYVALAPAEAEVEKEEAVLEEEKVSAG